jgi:hypothetical protein
MRETRSSEICDPSPRRGQCNGMSRLEDDMRGWTLVCRIYIAAVGALPAS